jgi:voltage-gated potassium channel
MDGGSPGKGCRRPSLGQAQMTLPTQIAIASAVVALSVVIHLVGLGALLAMLRRHRIAARPTLAIVLDGAAILLAAFGLFALHSLEIWIWAGVYCWLNVFGEFEQALYFSTSTYVTIGYGDVVLARGSRILGSIEGASGIILIGWSTAFFFSIVDRLKLLERGLEKNLDR